MEGVGGVLDGQRPRALVDPRAAENAVIERLQVAEGMQFRHKTCKPFRYAVLGGGLVVCARRATFVFGAVFKPRSTARICFVVRAAGSGIFAASAAVLSAAVVDVRWNIGSSV